MIKIERCWGLMSVVAIGLMASETILSAQATNAITCRLEKIDPAGLEPSLPVAAIPRMTQAPTIDGAWGSNEWDGTYQSGGFLIPATTNPAQPSTTFRMGLDDHNLYLAFRCGLSSNAEPQAVTTQHDGSVTKDDSIELFVWPDGAKPVYCHFMVNAVGVRFDQHCAFNPSAVNVDGSVERDSKWNPDWEAKTGREPGAWILEIAIPWSTLELEPKALKGIRINSCRNALPGPDRYSTWSYLPVVRFHKPDYFGIGLCAFDPASKPQTDIGSLGLGACGVLRTKRLSPMFPASDILAVRYDLPRHPLFAEQKIKLAAEFSSLDADGQPVNPMSLGQFDVGPVLPLQFVAQGLQRTNGVLKLSFQYGVTQDCSFIVLNQAMQDVFMRLQKGFQPDLVQKEPFKAAGYLGVAAALEKVKRQMAISTLLDPVISGLHEVWARLDVLEKRAGKFSRRGLLDLLTLAQIPESEVIVEYPIERTNSASVFFNWGAIPLALVYVLDCGSPEIALDALNQDMLWGLVPLDTEQITMEGCPARLRTKSFESESLTLSQFNPTNQVLLIDAKGKYGFAFSTQYVAVAKVDALVLLPECPANVSSQVTAWAKEKNIPIAGLLDEVLANTNVMLAGNAVAMTNQLAAYRFMSMTPTEGNIGLSVAAGRRLITVWNSPCRSVAEKAVRLVLRGKPVTVADVDALRSDLVTQLAPKSASAAKQEGLKLYCGDLHMHTFFSDGKPSPVGLALEALYCHMDFAAITDHNKLVGAQLAQRLFAKRGFAYSLIVGQEISTSWAHLNAYPLQEIIDAKLSPAETVAAVHRQNAVIQWNHPGYTTSEFETTHLKTGLIGTGCDAWEHYSPQYETWRKSGHLPVLIGSSDTHDGAFWAERTIVWAPSPQGPDVAEAILKGRTVMVSQDGTNFFYGSDPWVACAWAALADGQQLKAAKAEQLKAALASGDLVGLLQDSPSAPAP
ncbi:MAG: CehA/McbA family metallohydrolase [Verrucomicrobia bacterium]|nr:CehA/McbA family metallohydrolase [Verrucomicrobiota bacterium]MCG2679093.1 CehA/McbA family metallohydrolase [Kiritimatiellia bacterium]MBU4248427.1 CehA/McbA family metallohydrolase [Verrucomicrobiota bacterium]MBU4290915.1 CehA/McbA family metallohydrolase [Verrucomicrobiota bacterium]MBU4428036.1 CehA/McbA family metallohydrolase [Verrucomicrobiota bacterium]